MARGRIMNDKIVRVMLNVTMSLMAALCASLCAFLCVLTIRSLFVDLSSQGRTLSEWDAHLIGKVCVDHQGVNHVEVTSKDMVIYCADGLTYTNKLQK